MANSIIIIIISITIHIIVIINGVDGEVTTFSFHFHFSLFSLLTIQCERKKQMPFLTRIFNRGLDF